MNKTKSNDIMLTILCLVLIIVIFILNLFFPLGIAGGVMYTATIIITLWLPGRKFTTLFGIISLILTIVGFYLSPSASYAKTIYENRIAVIFLISTAVVFIFWYKTWDDRLRENEEKLVALFEASVEGIIISDSQGNIVMINKAGEKLFGYSRDYLRGKKIDLLLPERFKKDHQAHRLSYYNNPRPRPMGEGLELFAIRKDGQEFPVEISLNFFKTEEGLFVISYIVDITQRKTMESNLKIANDNLKRSMLELKRSNSELEQFAYVASHDLQEPLRMVASYTELLARRYKDKLDDNANDFIHYAVDGARRMQTLINDLLQFSRVGTRARPFSKTDCRLVVDIVLKNLDELIHETNTQFIIGDLPVINADESQLIQLFQNLIHNAIKFHDTHTPEITITAKKQDNNWLFAVKDNGIGIDPAYKDRIFMIFQRLHTRDEYPGSGIGLAICKKIVERHNGTIWFDSEPKQGTTFYFTIDADLK